MRASIDWERPDWYFAVGSLIASILLFVLLPQSVTLYRGDMMYYTVMERAIRDALGEGQFPLWHLYYSEPLVANPESMLFYPPYLLLRLLPVPAFYIASHVFHQWLFAVALYLLLRHFDITRLGSLAAAGAVAFSTQFMFRVVTGHITPLPIFGWSVLTLLFFGRLLHYGRYRDLLLCVLSCACMILAGHTQFSLTGLGLSGSYFLYYTIQTRQDWRSILRGLLYVLLLGLFSAGLLAALLLPIAEFASQNIRADGFSYLASMTAFALNTFTLWNVLLPFIPFEAVRDTVTVSETLYYSTMILPAMAWLALRFSPVQQRSLARYASLLGLIAVLLAMGSFGPFGRLIYAVVPFFRSPGRFLLLWVLTASILLALGVQVLEKGEAQRERLIAYLARALIIIPLIPLVLWSALRLRGGSLGPLTPLALWSSAVTFMAWVLLLASQRRIAWGRWLGLLVALILTDSAGNAVISTLWPSHIYSSVLGSERLFQCLAGQGAADPISLRVRPDDNLDLSPMPRAAATNGFSAIELGSASLTNVRDLMIAGRQGMRIMAVNASAPPLDALESDEVLIDVCAAPLTFDPLAAPRVGLVHRIRAVAEGREPSLQAVLDPNFDLLTEAVISVPEGAEPPSLEDSTQAFDAAAVITQFTPNQITIHTESSAPALLVLAEAYYPGWEATVNGQPANIWRANHALRGVFVPAGVSDVVMRYRSRPFERGLWISGGSLLALLALGLIWPRVKRWQNKESSS